MAARAEDFLFNERPNILSQDYYLKVLRNKSSDFRLLQDQLRDKDGMRALRLVLLLSLNAYKQYQKQKMEIFAATFACLPRFLDESKSFTANTVSTEPFGSTANLL